METNQDNRTLLILGNGFDVAFNFKTRYIDFYESPEFQQLLQQQNNIANAIKIETSQGKYQTWGDFECGLWEYVKKFSSCIDLETFKRDFDSLREALFNYLNRACQEPQNTFASLQIQKLVLLWQQYNPFVLTFNYSTTTIVNLAPNQRKYLNPNDSINENKFIYQHGSIYNTTLYQNNNPNTIVLGIDDSQEVPNDFAFLKKSSQNAHDQEDALSKLAQADTYIIYGCSMGDSDKVYFKTIFNPVYKGKKYIIYTHAESNVANVQNRVAEFVQDLEKFQQYNDVHIIYCKNNPRIIELTQEKLNKSTI